jgi:hypothetical protein
LQSLGISWLFGNDFIKKTTNYGIEKMHLLYIFPPELHTLMTSLFSTQPRKILFVVLQMGKAKVLSAPYVYSGI